MGKRLIFVTALVMMSSFAMGESLVQPMIPNLEVTSLYDFNNHQMLTALTSKVLSISVVDMRVGYVRSDENDIAIGALAFELSKLPKVQYAWSKMIDTSVGLWLGYDFKKSEVDYGVMAILVDIEFVK